MDSRAPLVAINGLLQEKPTGDRLSLPLRYAERVREAGGVPVAIPPIGDKRYLLALLDIAPRRRPRRGRGLQSGRPLRLVLELIKELLAEGCRTLEPFVQAAEVLEARLV